MEIVKKSKIFIAVFIILIVIFGVFLAYKKFYFKAPKNNISANIKQSTDQPAADFKASLPKIDYYKDFKLYKNSDFGFEIKYPASWTITEELNENVRGEMVKEFFFRKPNSDLRFVILPRDGLSYGLETSGTSTQVYIGGSLGMQTKYILKDGRRLWLLFPQTGLLNWLEDIGRIEAMTSADDPAGDTVIFEKMLNSFKFST